jgi:THO complex subunit 4
MDKWGHEGFEELSRKPSPPRQISGEVGYKLKITNLHYDIIEDDLQQLFGTMGTVLQKKVEYDSSGRSTGNAYVVMSTSSAAQKAIDEFDGRSIENQKFRVEEDGTVEIGEKKRAPARENRIERRQEPRGGDRDEEEDDPRPRGRGFANSRQLGAFSREDRQSDNRGRRGDRFNDDELKNLKVKVSF